MGLLKYVRILGFVSACAISVGCNLEVPSGHFEGNILKHSQDGYTVKPVKIEISKQSSSQIRAEVRNLSGKILGIISVSAKSSEEIWLCIYQLSRATDHSEDTAFPPVEPKFHSLKKSKTEGSADEYQCYGGIDTWRLELCFTKDQFYFKIIGSESSPLFTLSGNSFSKIEPFSIEEPISMTLDQAVEIAFKNGFDARIAYEHVVQAQGTALAAWLNLVPHLTSNLIWNAEFGYVSAVATLQGLTPFLLPTYWLQAKEASIDAKIKKDSQTIVLADLVTSVEQLTYSLTRDSQLSKTHQEILDRLALFQTTLAEKQKLGMSVEVATQLKEASETVREWVVDSKAVFDRTLKEDQFALSQALGFHNPEAVREVAIEGELMPIEEAVKVGKLESQALATSAMERSFELQQMQYLKQISDLKGIELYFNWIDPTGDPKGSLGLNLIGQFRVTHSQKEELHLKEEQLQLIIFQNSYRVALDYNQALDAYVRMKERKHHSERHYADLLEASLQSGSLTVEDLKTTVQEELSNAVQRESNLSIFRCARAKKDRLLLAGYYEKLLPHLPRFEFKNY